MKKEHSYKAKFIRVWFLFSFESEFFLENILGDTFRLKTKVIKSKKGFSGESGLSIFVIDKNGTTADITDVLKFIKGQAKPENFPFNVESVEISTRNGNEIVLKFFDGVEIEDDLVSQYTPPLINPNYRLFVPVKPFLTGFITSLFSKHAKYFWR
jgi:hypothetical protein